MQQWQKQPPQQPLSHMSFFPPLCILPNVIATRADQGMIFKGIPVAVSMPAGKAQRSVWLADLLRAPNDDGSMGELPPLSVGGLSGECCGCQARHYKIQLSSEIQTFL